MLETMTVEEGMEFSRALRAPNSSHADVEHMLDLMRLQKARSTYIGSVTVKGISGGERKR